MSDKTNIDHLIQEYLYDAEGNRIEDGDLALIFETLFFNHQELARVTITIASLVSALEEADGTVLPSGMGFEVRSTDPEEEPVQGDLLSYCEWIIEHLERTTGISHKTTDKASPDEYDVPKKQVLH